MEIINPKRHRITDEISLENLSHILIKVKDHRSTDPNEEFCYVYTFEEAEQLMASLAATLVHELCSESDVKSGWAQVSREDKNRIILISKRTLGRLYNGTKVPVYTITSTEVCHGVCQESKLDEIVSDLKEKLKKI